MEGPIMKYRMLLALVLIVPITYCATKRPELPPEARAKALCRGEIGKRLKDPSSAEYGPATAQQTAAGAWLIYRQVTAKNSFGALIKATMVCSVSPDFEVVTVNQQGGTL